MSEETLVPPHSIEAEQAVLAAVLVDPACLADVRALLRSPAAFWRVSHQHVYSAVIELAEAGADPDWVTIVEHVKRAGKLAECGGPEALHNYLLEISHRLPSSYGVERHAAIVRDRALLRAIVHLAGDVRSRALDDTCSSQDALHFAVTEFTRLEGHTVRGEPRPIGELVSEARGLRVKMQDWRSTNPGALPGLSSGYSDVDAITAGWQGGELILLGGRPGEGKSSLLNSCALNVAFAEARGESGRAVLLFSREMTALENTRRMIAARAQVDGRAYRLGALSRQDTGSIVEAENELAQLPLQLEDCFDSTVSEMLVKARRVQQRSGLALVLVDYVQIVQPDQQRADRHIQIGQISRGLKRLARQLDVPVLAAVQLNRDLEKGPRRKPRLSDLRESGDLEQDADQVWLIHREDPDDPDNGAVALLCRKNRNGPTGDVPLWFDRRTTSFVPIRRTAADFAASRGAHPAQEAQP